MKHSIRLDDLTRREREVLLLTAKGLTAQEIGDKLEVTSRTVDWHTVSLHEKLGTSNKVQLCHAAYFLGLIVFTKEGVAAV